LIERAPRSRSFTVLDNQVVNDPALSFGAKGLLAFILSKPDHWRTDRDHLARQGPDGEKAVRALLRELEQAGYLTRQRHRDRHGRIGWKRVVHELPVPAPQRTGHSRPPTSDNDAKPQVAPLARNRPVAKSDTTGQGADLRKRSKGAARTTSRLRTGGEQASGHLSIASTEEQTVTPDGVTAAALLAEYIAEVRTRTGIPTYQPPPRVRGILARQLAELVAAGIPLEAIRAGLADYAASDRHPSVLSSLVDVRLRGGKPPELARRLAGNGQPAATRADLVAWARAKQAALDPGSAGAGEDLVALERDRLALPAGRGQTSRDPG